MDMLLLDRKETSMKTGKAVFGINAITMSTLGRVPASWILPLSLSLALPIAAEAQFGYTTNDGTITITGYTGPGGAVDIPSTINGLPVTGIGWHAFIGTSLTSVTIPSSVSSIIGDDAFVNCRGLTAITVDALNPTYSSVDGVLFDKSQTTLLECPGGKARCSIPNSVTSIGDYAFEYCTSLTSVTINNSVTSIGDQALSGCTSLTSITIPDSVTCIGWMAFFYCTSLASVTIGSGVTDIEAWAFSNCGDLTSVFFQGNAPGCDYHGVFNSPATPGNPEVWDPATIYYLPGTTGWGTMFGGLPTVLWNPQVQTSDASFGIRTNQFGFNITGNRGLVVVVEACTNLANPTWYPLQTITLTGGSVYFSDPQWTNYGSRFYRLSMP